MPRKYPQGFSRKLLNISSFNEAGADAPEIPSCPKTRLPPRQRFNEAGADAPEIPRPLAGRGRGGSCFNEAGADAPEIPCGLLNERRRLDASMRPGRMPRKYQPGRQRRLHHIRRFNEAGADAPEIPGHHGHEMKG